MPSGKKHIRYRPVKNRKKAPAGGLRYGPVFTGCPAVELAVERLYQAGDAQREERFWGLVKGLNYALQMQTHVLVPVRLTPEGSQGQFSWASHPIPPEKAGGLELWALSTPKGYKVLPAFTRPSEADASPATLGLPMAELPLQQVMEEALQREDLNGMVLNPWGRSATLDKGLLRGLLYAHGPEDAPGEAEARQGRQLAAQGRWAEAEPLFAASAALGCPEGLRRLAGCYDTGRGIGRDRRKAMTLWRKAAAQGDVLAQVAIGDRYAAGTARTPGDPGKALMAYRRACAMAETEMDITTWPVLCLRMAGAEAGATDKEQVARLLAEAVHGLHLLCKEEEDAEARQELARAVAALADCAREIYAGAANLQELLQKLAAQLNTESLHFN